MSLLKLQVIGHLGQDATTNVVNGKNVINLSVAFSEKWKDAQGVQKEKTIWVSASWWTDRTNILPYLKKGTMVYVDGQPDAKTYTTQRGEVVAQLTVRVNEVKLLGSNKENKPIQQQNSEQPTGDNSNNQVNQITEPVDDLPF